jgi:hypothetical protein
MNGYSITLFLHIVGALGFFVALGLEWISLRHIRGAVTAKEVGVWIGISNSALRLGIISMLTILASGIYMMATAWGGVGWIITALAALILVFLLSVGLTRPRMAALRRSLATAKGSLPPAFDTLANHPLLWISIQTRVSIALGIVFLMTLKPGLGGSLVAIGVAIALGFATALPVYRRERLREGSTD